MGAGGGGGGSQSGWVSFRWQDLGARLELGEDWENVHPPHPHPSF